MKTSTVSVAAGILLLLVGGDSQAQERVDMWEAGLTIGSLEVDGPPGKTGGGAYLGFRRALNVHQLLGAEASLWTKRGNTDITQSLLTAVTDVYPLESTGIFLRFGFSLAYLAKSDSFDSERAFGIALGVGLGADIPAWEGFSVRPSVRLAWGAAGTVTSLSEFRIGLSWD